jgi:hypothetical protein
MKFNRYNKYHNTKVETLNCTFDSQKEFTYFHKLLLLENAGEITELKRQVEFELQPSFKLNGKTIRAIKYIADFTYLDKQGVLHIIDVKGFRNEIYRLKYKLFAYKYGKEIEEV